MNPFTNRAVKPHIRDIWAARKKIASFVANTPLYKSPILSEETHSSVFLKMEIFHEPGSFKIRGAANKILSLSHEQQRAGVATFSTGNHGLAVAYVAKQLSLPAFVFISERVLAVKVQALRRLGATLMIQGHGQDDAEEYCYKVAQERGLTIVQPFDDPYVIAGQGTIGLELLNDCPQIDKVIVPLSGGGLLAGIALALKSSDPAIRVVGVSMERSAVMYHSLREGKPVVLKEEDTLADSLLGGLGRNNQYTFRMVRELVDETVLVSEEAIAEGMAYLFKNHQLVVEGAAATGIAALRHLDIVKPGENVAVIITGKSVDASTFINATKKYL